VSEKAVKKEQQFLRKKEEEKILDFNYSLLVPRMIVSIGEFSKKLLNTN
tara:strand:+ start:121 stop:267 length:147 start_codon:yes stop_codon:yes gene_type:complete